MIEFNYVEVTKLFAVGMTCIGYLIILALAVRGCISLWLKNFRAGKNALEYAINRQQFKLWKVWKEQNGVLLRTAQKQNREPQGEGETE